MRDTCADIREQISDAIEGGKEELPDMQYSETLMEALRAEKKSVSEMILLTDEMMTSLQEHMEREDGEGEKEKERRKARRQKMKIASRMSGMKMDLLPVRLMMP